MVLVSKGWIRTIVLFIQYKLQLLSFRSNQLFAVSPRVFGVLTNPTGFVLLFHWIYLSVTLRLCNLKCYGLQISVFYFAKVTYQTILFVSTSSEITLACLLFIVTIIWFVFAFLWICFGPSSGFVRGDTLDLRWSGFGGYLSALWSGNCPAWWRTISVAISKFGLVLQKGNNNRQLGDVLVIHTLPVKWKHFVLALVILIQTWTVWVKEEYFHQIFL